METNYNYYKELLKEKINSKKDNKKFWKELANIVEDLKEETNENLIFFIERALLTKNIAEYITEKDPKIHIELVYEISKSEAINKFFGILYQNWEETIKAKQLENLIIVYFAYLNELDYIIVIKDIKEEKKLCFRLYTCYHLWTNNIINEYSLNQDCLYLLKAIVKYEELNTEIIDKVFKEFESYIGSTSGSKDLEWKKYIDKIKKYGERK